MPLTDVQKRTLYSLLEQSGWSWRDDFIHAPHGTLWFNRETPWVDDVIDFYDRMCRRRARIENICGTDSDVAPALSDVGSLVAALNTMQPK